MGHKALNDKQVTNHYLAHPEAVLGAMLGPVSEVRAAEVHCSPLMTRPNDVDKKRVILDLSNPRGVSLNDIVDRNKFDHNNFSLKLTCIDDIGRDIETVSNPLLFKVDVTWTFIDLRVVPV